MKNKFSIYVKIKKKNGLTLIEVLMYVTLLGIIAPIISLMFMHGYNSYKSNYNLIKQEDIASNITQMLRNDIEYASSVTLYSTDNKKIDLKFPVSSGKKDKTWIIDASSKTIKVQTNNDGVVKSSVIAENIDVANSKFEYIPSGTNGHSTIVFAIKPIDLNIKRNENRNLNTIITEISVRYKPVNII